jgi:hypothetical protein
MHGDARPHERRDDVGLQVGEGEDEVGREGENLPDIGADEGRHPRLLPPDLRRTHRIARDADDTVLLAQQVERLHGFLGEADDAAGRKHCGSHSKLWPCAAAEFSHY